MRACSTCPHMGQAFLVAADKSHETVARALETLIPADILNLKPGQQRYSQLLDEKGGILDDLMVSRSATRPMTAGAMLVVNASMKDADYAHIAGPPAAGREPDARRRPGA